MDRQGKIRPEAPQEQLFQLETDPQQQRNVVREHPQVAAKLKAQLDAIQAGAPTSPTAPRAVKKSSKEN